ncbi:hypothetical protein evm_003014 [Chilo suppressalis]|nr:hypothetical protein evm_003014 [Chilo suppressalis]
MKSRSEKPKGIDPCHPKPCRISADGACDHEADKLLSLWLRDITLIPYIFAVLIVHVYTDEDYSDYYKGNPAYCTEIQSVKTKTFGVGEYYNQFNYPPVYLIPRQKEAAFILYCDRDGSFDTWVKVCDWDESPLVDLAIGETHLTIVRRDFGKGLFLGNAIINVTQRCRHSPHSIFYGLNPVLTEFKKGKG